MTNSVSHPPIVCCPSALSAEERERARALRREFSAAISRSAELPHGYAFSCGSRPATLRAIAEWIPLERRCCPFLSFELSWAAERSDFQLAVTGPAGSKEFLAAELPALPRSE